MNTRLESPSSSIPFSVPNELVEYEHTTAARKLCPSCGEWAYPRRKLGSQKPFAFAPECGVCSKPFPEDA